MGEVSPLGATGVLCQGAGTEMPFELPIRSRRIARAMRLADPLFAERFEQSVFCLRVIHDGDPGGQVVG